MDIHSLLDTSTIIPAQKPMEKEELLLEMLGSLSSKLDAEVLDEVKQAVIQRERIMSTGVGKGLAIPHGKTAVVNQNYAVFARIDGEVDYESIDDIPVRMIFLLVGPISKNNIHIKLLSRISRLMNSATFRDKILECDTSEEILSAFTNEELKYFPATS